MLNYDSIERNKSLIVNILIVVIALFFAFQLHKSSNEQINALVQQQGSELEKNKLSEDIVLLEQKTEKYRNTFVKRDLGEIMDILTGITKNTTVKILSVKPFAEELTENYRSASFIITLKVSGYHALGDFISQIENHKDIYLVSEININSPSSQPASLGENTELNVTLKINTISYL